MVTQSYRYTPESLSIEITKTILRYSPLPGTFHSQAELIKKCHKVVDLAFWIASGDLNTWRYEQ
jgi:hypothetical protein